MRWILPNHHYDSDGIVEDSNAGCRTDSGLVVIICGQGTDMQICWTQISIFNCSNIILNHIFSLATTGHTKQTATQLALNLFREKGIAGLYRGLGSTMARDVTFSVIYFPLFAKLDSLVISSDDDRRSYYYRFRDRERPMAVAMPYSGAHLLLELSPVQRHVLL